MTMEKVGVVRCLGSVRLLGKHSGEGAKGLGEGERLLEGKARSDFLIMPALVSTNFHHCPENRAMWAKERSSHW